MDELLELTIKRIDALEKRLEKYYHLLEVKNELDFILNGGYIFKEDIDAIMSGNYLMQGESANTDNEESDTSASDTNTNEDNTSNDVTT